MGFYLIFFISMIIIKKWRPILFVFCYQLSASQIAFGSRKLTLILPAFHLTLWLEAVNSVHQDTLQWAMAAILHALKGKMAAIVSLTLLLKEPLSIVKLSMAICSSIFSLQSEFWPLLVELLTLSGPSSAKITLRLKFNNQLLRSVQNMST